MTWWLYQMTAHDNSHEYYNSEVCEGIDSPHYYIRKLRSEGGKLKTGDGIVLFYAWSGDMEGGGICGWGAITGMKYDKEENDFIIFKPREPSNHLKMKPILNKMVKDITKEIRHHAYQGTMWEIPPNLLVKITQMIEQAA